MQLRPSEQQSVMINQYTDVDIISLDDDDFPFYLTEYSFLGKLCINRNTSWISGMHN